MIASTSLTPDEWRLFDSLIDAEAKLAWVPTMIGQGKAKEDLIQSLRQFRDMMMEAGLNRYHAAGEKYRSRSTTTATTP